MPAEHPDNLAAALTQTWDLGRTGRSAEALTEVRQLLERARAGDDTRNTAESLTQISWFCLQLGHAEQGLDCIIAAKSLWAQCGSSNGEANAAAIYAWLLVELGLVDEGFAEANKAVDLAEIESDPRVLAFATNAKAVTLMYSGQGVLVGQLLDRSLKLVRGDLWAEGLYLVNLAYSQVSLAEAAEHSGDTAEGRQLRELALLTNDRAIAVAEACGDKWCLRVALCNGAEYYAQVGQIERGMAYLERWTGVAGDIGLREHIHYLYTRGELLTLAGRLPEALEICAEAVALADGSTSTDSQANTCRRLAEVYEKLGHFEQALAYHKRFHAAYQKQTGEVTRRRAQLLEMQLENHKLRARAAAFEEEAARDALTGLPNRRSFDAAFQQLLGSRFCLGILDLDHFKAVNDRYSHLVGDSVLRQVAEVLGSLGPGMQGFRLGGEEFALLFPEHDLAAARAVAEAVREEFERTQWSVIAPGLRVTASIGLAAAKRGVGLPDLMATADRRLYQAKALGRNRLVWIDAGEGMGLSA